MFISYAQNFEDVILWRALKDIENGCYIDIGAQDPVRDSVSLAFYNRNWRGVNIEASANYAEALRNARPEDIVIEALVGENPGQSEFYEIVGTGMSTADAELAGRHAANGHQICKKLVRGISLASILDAHKDRPIHWLKIDVEGYEWSVIRSWSPSTIRPWIVVVESVDPITHQEKVEWEPDLCALGYDFVYFDGLNRFYLSHQHSELKRAFGAGPNVFDGFTLNGTASSPFCNLQLEQLAAHSAGEAELSSQLTALQGETHRLEAKYATREAELGSQLTALQAETNRLGAKHAAREAELTGQLTALRAETHRLGAKHAAREAELSGQLTVLQAETHRLGAKHAAREAELTSQLTALRAETHRIVNLVSSEIAVLRNSTSWRITRPFRSTGIIVKRWQTKLVLGSGVVARRCAGLVRRRAPRLYSKLSTMRAVSAVYKPLVSGVAAVPSLAPIAAEKRWRTKLVLGSGFVVRRCAGLVRRRAPRLYSKLSTMRAVSAVYKPLVSGVAAVPSLAPTAVRQPDPMFLMARLTSTYDSPTTETMGNLLIAMARWPIGRRVHARD